MATKNIAIQIDITDQNTDTDASQGLYAGFFRWVSGRPDYDGATVIPTGDNDGNVWKEGLLTNENSVGMPDRIIDINLGGDYASLSGFSFTRDNSVKFQNYLDTNEYYIINRPIEFHIILDDVFIQTWTGIISDIIFNENTYEIICEDIFESEHPAIPPNTITKNNSPDAPSDSIGKSVPVVFGDVLRSSVVNNTGSAKRENLGYSDKLSKELFVSGCESITLSSDDDWIVELKTPNVSFGANHFRDTGQYWISVIVGGDQSVYIADNEESTGTGNDITTNIILSKPFDDITRSVFNSDHSYPETVGQSTKSWWFEIIKLDTAFLVSNNQVNEFPKNTSNEYNFTRYNKDKEVYTSIPELITGADTTTSNKYGYPNVQLVINDIDFEGNFKRLVPITPEKIIDFNSYDLENPTNEFNTNDFTNLLDKDRTTSLQIYNASGNNEMGAGLEIIFPKDFIIDGLDEVYMCWDLEVTTKTGSSTIELSIGFNGVDVYNKTIVNYGELNPATNIYPSNVPNNAVTDYNFLPNDYYLNGNDNSEDSVFGREVNGEFVNQLIKIPSDLIDSFKTNSTVGLFRFSISVATTNGNDEIERFKLKQVGFYATENLNLNKDQLFIKTKGETQSGNETDNVYNTFKHVLLDYDGFSSINEGNIATERNTWPIGRTLTEKKSSSVYLKELCLTSFVTITSNRYGVRTLSAFRENTTVVFTHTDTNGTILRDSITSFEKSDISDVYNEFDLQYDYNPATKGYNRNIFITKIGVGATFPAVGESTGTDTVRTFSAVNIKNITIDGKYAAKITFGADPTWAVIGDKISYASDVTASFEFGTIYAKFTNEFNDPELTVIFDNTLGALMGEGSIGGTLTSHSEVFPTWTTYVGGINDYVTAKQYWQSCQDSFVRTKTVNKYPENLSKLNWYHDPGAFIGESPSFDSGAHRYVALLVPWATRQKDIAKYSLPLSAANLQLELINYGEFADTIYTNGNTRNGYISKIKVDARNDKIDLEVTLIPTDIQDVFGNLIVETGSAPDTITESGSQPDTITETGA